MSSSEESYDSQEEAIIPEKVTSKYLIRKRIPRGRIAMGAIKRQKPELDLLKLKFAIHEWKKDRWDALEKTRWAKTAYVEVLERKSGGNLQLLEILKRNYDQVQFDLYDLDGIKCKWCKYATANYLCRVELVTNFEVCEVCQARVERICEIYKFVEHEMQEFARADGFGEDEIYEDFNSMILQLTWELSTI